jgi:type IV secretion system protein VirD4
MFQLFEELSYYFIRWLYLQPQWVGILLLGGPGLLLLMVQFQKVKETWVPGTFSVLFITAAGFHFLKREEVAGLMTEWLAALGHAQGTLVPLPLVEPIAEILVGPLSTRYVYQEVLSLAILGYFSLVVFHSILEYRKTGIVIGDLSFAGLFNRSAARPKRSKSNELGSGDLANTEQIAKWTKTKGEPQYDTKLQVSELRGSDGLAFKSAELTIPRNERNRHILMVAKTGSGKTTSLILPVLYDDCLNTERSTIVIDSKPEMWDKLANLTAKYNPGKNILLFNPLDTMRSLSWNILGKIEDDTDAKLIANTIIMATDQPTAKSDSPFFRNNALAILNSIMVGLLHDPKETLSMPRVHELVQSGMKPLSDWLEAHPHALRNTRTFVELARSGSQNADTIMSELSMRLSAWDLQAIRATTEANELNVQDIIDKPTLFIVELRESELEMLRPMANVIVVELLRFLTKYAERCPGTALPRPVGFVIDEFASALGRLPDIHVKLNTLRSRNISIVAAIQSIAQVKANYSEHADSVLAGFSTKIFMPNLDQQDGEWASKESGQMTIRFQTNSTGSNRKMIEFFASKNDSIQEQVQQRPVLTPDEIAKPADNICTFFFPNTPVFQGFLIPYYKIPWMLKRFEEFKGQEPLKLREKPIEYEEALPHAGPAQSAAASTAPGALPAGITNTAGWTAEQVDKKLEEVKKNLDWDNTTGSARKWWEAFENENKTRTALVLRLAEELQNRKATITEFFLAYVYSNTDNIQANLCYLDYTRLKKEEERKKKEAAQKAREGGGQAAA